MSAADRAPVPTAPGAPRGRRRSVTMADVARHAGVSKKTVSSVVNATGQVSAATRLRVQAAVDQLGYLPDPLARRLTSGHADTITLAVPRLGSGDMAQLTAAVVTAAEGAGLNVLCEPSGTGAAQNPDALRPEVGISDGVLLVPTTSAVVTPPSLPVVVLGDRALDADVDQVLFSVQASLSEGLGLLPDGARALVLVEPAQAELVPPDSSYIALVTSDGTAIGGRNAIRLADLAAADGVIALGGSLAVGALHALAERGLRVPEDLPVIAVGSDAEADFTHPSLTTVAWDVEALADQALEHLLSRIGGDDSPARTIVVPTVLTRRESA